MPQSGIPPQPPPALALSPPPLGATSENFSKIYEEHARHVYYVALRMLGDPVQAEDATHDVFVKVFRNLDRFRGESCVKTWLYRLISIRINVPLLPGLQHVLAVVHGDADFRMNTCRAASKV